MARGAMCRGWCHCGCHYTSANWSHARPSTVAFYGNQALGNRYLGRGTFIEYVSLDTDRGREIARESPLYSRRGMPGSTRGFVLLRDFHLATAGQDLSSLSGKIEASGRALSVATLPAGPARAQVYYE